MLKTRTAATAGRHDVDRVFLWIEQDVPGVCIRWHLNNDRAVVIHPGMPLDLRLSTKTFKMMMREHVDLCSSVSAEVRRYLQNLEGNLAAFKIGGGLVLLLVFCNFCFLSSLLTNSGDSQAVAAHTTAVQGGCASPPERLDIASGPAAVTGM